MSDTRVVALHLPPIPNDTLVGAKYDAEGVGTFQVWPGEVEVVNGIKVKHPPRWVRVE